MKILEFSSFMEQRGCINIGKDFFGSYNSIPFVVNFLTGAKDGSVIFSLRLQTIGAPPGRLFSTLRKQMKDYAKLRNVAKTKNIFNILVTTKKNLPLEEVFDQLFAELDATIAMLGIELPDTCPICKRSDCDSFAYIGLTYQMTHEDCVRSQSADIQTKVQENEMSGGYLLGIVGAVLGGLVGIIPSVILAIFMNMISGWLCALIPLCAYYGYKLFGGKMSRGTLGIIVVVSLLMVPATQYLFELSWSIKEGYGAFSLLEYFEYIAAYPSEILPSMLQTLLFIGIGFALVFRFVSRNNTNTLQQVTFSEETLRPIPQDAKGERIEY